MIYGLSLVPYQSQLRQSVFTYCSGYTSFLSRLHFSYHTWGSSASRHHLYLECPSTPSCATSTYIRHSSRTCVCFAWDVPVSCVCLLFVQATFCSRIHAPMMFIRRRSPKSLYRRPPGRAIMAPTNGERRVRIARTQALLEISQNKYSGSRGETSGVMMSYPCGGTLARRLRI